MDELPSPDSQQPDTTQATDHSVQASDLSSQNFVCPAEPEGKCCPESIASLQQDTHVCGAEIRLGSGFDIGRAVSITEKTPRSEFVEKWLEGTTDAFAPRGSVREKALLVRLPQQSGPLSSTQRTEQNMSSSSNRRAWIDSLGNIHWSTKSRRDSSSNKHDDRVYSRGREGSVLPQSSPNSKGHTVRFSGSTRGGDGGGGGGSSCSRGHRRGRYGMPVLLS